LLAGTGGLEELYLRLTAGTARPDETGGVARENVARANLTRQDVVQ
jgi:hypothetical protein